MHDHPVGDTRQLRVTDVLLAALEAGLQVGLQRSAVHVFAPDVLEVLEQMVLGDQRSVTVVADHGVESGALGRP